VQTRSGGFGGDVGFQTYLKDHQITAVLDATHPFAARVSERTWRICREFGLPCVQLDRSAWQAGDEDNWTEVESAAEAAAATAPGRRYFVTTGRETLPAFWDATDRRFLFRHLREGPSQDAPPHITFVRGNGPFSVEQERDLFQELRIDGLICKNAGGVLSRTKLDAARDLRLPVILLRRPQPTGAPLVHSVAEALDWVKSTCL
jgi:precorrin-6A/cobalt-precorrin-6A reductase